MRVSIRNLEPNCSCILVPVEEAYFKSILGLTDCMITCPIDASFILVSLPTIYVDIVLSKIDENRRKQTLASLP